MVPLILITGFGPFPGVEHNPSAGLVRALEARPPAGVTVRGVILPVTFDGVAAAFDTALDAPAGPRPMAILSLGVHPGPEFRLEQCARGTVDSERVDASGMAAQGQVLADGRPRATTLALEPLAQALSVAGARQVIQSRNAGGYVCERTYHHALGRAAELGIASLFLHVPSLDHVELRDQEPPVRALATALSRIAGGPSS